MHTVSGIVESIIFNNVENGYCVFSIEYEDEELVCTGNLPFLNEGEEVSLAGDYIIHPTYGKQFAFTEYSKTAPKDALGIVKYLGSGVIKGIGEKTAEQIVKRFGDQTFEVMENYPEKLAEIKGISIAKATAISAQFHEQLYQRQAMMFLHNYGITAATAAKIWDRYKERTIATMNENPYELANDIIGFGFKSADSIAYRMGIEPSNMHRIKSGIRYVLMEAVTEGHSFYPKERLVEKSAELLEAPKELVQNGLMELHIEKSVVMENLEDITAVYLGSYYYAENYVARKLVELDFVKDDEDNSQTENILRELCEELNIDLAEKQLMAVRQSLKGGVLVITGGPGTGKTTTIKAIIEALESSELIVQLAAPTGRAAKRMTEATGKEAKTIHRLLEVKFLANDARRQTFEKNEDDPLETDVLIIDEISMVDIMLMMHLLKALQSGTRLILVGDVNQLPSVGAGNVLKDILISGCLNSVYLDEIFRQAQLSHIVLNAHRINQGDKPLLNETDSDFFMMRRGSIDSVATSICELVSDRLPKYGNYNPAKDIQVLTPMRKSRIGALGLNKDLQNVLNPSSPRKREYEYRGITFREGDKVMQIKNNYNIEWDDEESTGVFNGDQGIIDSISLLSEKLKVAFDDGKNIEYDFTQLEELELAYAITIHKSQGSEYKVVVIPIHSGPPMLLTRNLLYTAVTRARNLVVIVGTEECVNMMVGNNREILRYSALDKKIVKFAGVLDRVK
ncbi:MAG: ATP-dependent RecD-like DNA helicase [Defluviitaleaceae bacterium]|nr:ATP-dependent RecD-like DNA helicase [Defluviitaleaceae bacterium]